MPEVELKVTLKPYAVDLGKKRDFGSLVSHQ